MRISIAGAIIIEDGKVLLVQQRKSRAYGLWSFPGGHVEPHESPLEAVRREVMEEIGAKLEAATPFKVSVFTGQEGELELTTFTGTIHRSITIQEDELMAYGWFSLDTLETMQKSLRAPVMLELIREALKIS